MCSPSEIRLQYSTGSLVHLPLIYSLTQCQSLFVINDAKKGMCLLLCVKQTTISGDARWIEGWEQSTVLFAVSSIFIFLTFRNITVAKFKLSQVFNSSKMEIVQIFNRIEVVKTVPLDKSDDSTKDLLGRCLDFYKSFLLAHGTDDFFWNKECC